MATNFDNDDAETQYMSDSDYKYMKEEPGDVTSVSVPLSDSAEDYLKNGLLEGWNGIGSFSEDALLAANLSGGLSQCASLQTPNYMPNSQTQHLFDFGLGAVGGSLTEVHNVSSVLENQELGLHGSFSQQSVVSQEDHVQTTEKYVGDFNFHYKFSDLPTKKFVFSTHLDKLFVVNGENVDIQFSYDHEKAKEKKIEMKLVCFLRYTRPEDTDSIQRCAQHLAEAKGKMDSQRGGISDAEGEKLKHVLVSVNPKAVHFTDDKGRLKVEIPVKAPAAGCDYVSQLFSFGCMNSCRVSKKTTSRQWTAVFELQKTANNRVLGRQGFQVKVCACPQRDMNKEENPSPGVKKLSKKSTRGGATGPNPTTKRVRTGNHPLREENGMLQDSIDELDAPSSQELSEDVVLPEHRFEITQCMKKCNKLLLASLSPVPEIKLFGEAFKALLDAETLKMKTVKRALRAVRQSRADNPEPDFMKFDSRNKRDNL